MVEQKRVVVTEGTEFDKDVWSILNLVEAICSQCSFFEGFRFKFPIVA